MMLLDKKFWVVWEPDSGHTSQPLASHQEALQFAKGMVDKETSCTYYILVVEKSVTKSDYKEVSFN